MDQEERKKEKLKSPGMIYSQAGRVKRLVDIISLCVDLSQGTEDKVLNKYLINVAQDLAEVLAEELKENTDE